MISHERMPVFFNLVLSHLSFWAYLTASCAGYIILIGIIIITLLLFTFFVIA